jgi:hypothetical protein
MFFDNMAFSQIKAGFHSSCSVDDNALELTILQDLNITTSVLDYKYLKLQITFAWLWSRGPSYRGINGKDNDNQQQGYTTSTWLTPRNQSGPDGKVKASAKFCKILQRPARIELTNLHIFSLAEYSPPMCIVNHSAYKLHVGSEGDSQERLYRPEH